MIEPVLRFNRLKSKLVRRFGVFLPTGNWIMNRIHIHQGQRGYWSEDLAQSEGTRLVYYSIQSSMTLSLVRRWSSPLSSQNLTHITNFEISRKEKTEKKILEKRGSSLPVVRRGTDGDRRSWKRSFPPLQSFSFSHYLTIPADRDRSWTRESFDPTVLNGNARKAAFSRELRDFPIIHDLLDRLTSIWPRLRTAEARFILNSKIRMGAVVESSKERLYDTDGVNPEKWKFKFFR